MELYPICDESMQITPNLWYSVSGTGESPFMRVGHTCIHLVDESPNGKLYFIGGANPSECFNDVYILDLNNLNWDKFTDLVNFETGRYEHACFKSSNNTIYIFGGANQEKNHNDVILFNTENKCEKFEALNSITPTARTYHCGVSFKEQLIVFGGGECGKTAVSDSSVYILNPKIKKWISLQLKDDQPDVRHGHVMINHNDEFVYLTGGMNDSRVYDDLWILDLKKMKWKKIESNDVKPCARAAHGAVSINKFLYLFGGMDSDGNVLNDLWKYDIELNKWSIIEIFGYKPPPRLDFAYCKVEIKKNEQYIKSYFFIHGGMDNEGNIFDDGFIILLD